MDITKIKPTIFSEIERLADEQKVRLPRLSDDLVLQESGFDSLWFAVLVARLEDLFELDPFTDAADREFPVTLGDFVRAYENAAK